MKIILIIFYIYSSHSNRIKINKTNRNLRMLAQKQYSSIIQQFVKTQKQVVISEKQMRFLIDNGYKNQLKLGIGYRYNGEKYNAMGETAKLCFATLLTGSRILWNIIKRNKRITRLKKINDKFDDIKKELQISKENFIDSIKKLLQNLEIIDNDLLYFENEMQKKMIDINVSLQKRNHN